MSTLFRFEDAAVAIGQQTLLHKLNWEIRRGGHTCITGRNGAGKTILCQALCGQVRIARGRARPVDIGYEQIAMVSFTDKGKLFHSVNNQHYYQQRFNAWDADGHLTVRDYLNAHGAHLIGNKQSSFLSQIGLSDLLDIERIKLSSGQTRKMLLASALLKKPQLLILDNAYIGLDPFSRMYLNKFLDQLAEETDCTIIISGHQSELPDCIKYHIQIKEQTLNFTENLIQEQPHQNITKPQRAILNSLADYNSKNKQSYPISELVCFNNVDIRYKTSQILSLPEWSVKKGEYWSVFGPNGSGKSTLVSIIYADHPQAYSQAIQLFGSPLGRGRSIWEIKTMIGFTSPELHAFFHSQLTFEQVVCTGLFDKFELMGPVPQSKLEFALLLCSYFEIQHLLPLPYHQLSTGQQRLCLFLRALIKCPVLFLLDEPFQGFDDEHIILAKELLNSIISKEQSLVFISHFKNEIPSLVTNTLSL